MPDETRETAFPDDSRNAKEKSPGNAADDLSRLFADTPGKGENPVPASPPAPAGPARPDCGGLPRRPAHRLRSRLLPAGRPGPGVRSLPGSRSSAARSQEAGISRSEGKIRQSRP